MTDQPAEDPAGSGPATDLVIAAPTATQAPPVRGLFRLTMDGREAPALFVVGWLATVVGGISTLVGSLAGVTTAGAMLFVAGLALLFLGLLLLGGSQAVERRAASLAYAGPSPILVFGACIAGLYLAVVIVATPLRLFGVTLEGSSLSLFGVVLQAGVVLAVLRLLVVGQGSLSWAEMGVRGSVGSALRDLARGAILAPPIVIVTALVVAFLVNAIGSSPESPLPPTGTSLGLVVNLVAGAVIAPFYEELLFRGFATTAWARMIPPAAAVVRTSILFALAHVLTQGGINFGEALGLAVVAGASRLPVAFALGAVFVRRQSLWASIGLHAAFNAILILLAEWALRNPVPFG